MGAAHRVDRQSAARQDHHAAEAAAMITIELFAYTDAEWNAIREQVLI